MFTRDATKRSNPLKAIVDTETGKQNLGNRI